MGSLTADIAAQLGIDWTPPAPDPYADAPLTSAVARSIVPPIPSDPVQWCSDNGLELWSKQIEIVDALSANRYISCRSCNGSGKTQLSSAIAVHHALTNLNRDSIVVVLSSGWDNIRTGVRRRMLDIVSDWNLPGKVLDRGYTVNGKELVTFRSPPKGAVAGRKLLQGIHARYILVIVDEANEIPAPLWAEMLSIATGRHVTVLAIANPTATGTPFEGTFEPESGWHNIHISYEDMPAVTGEPVSQAAAESLLDAETVAQMQRDLAEYEIAARVYGEFPAESQLAFFRQTKVKEAIERILEPAQQAPIYALDPGSGGDPSVLGRRDGSVIELIDLGEFRKSDDRKAVASHVASIVEQDEKTPKAINVDTFGVGADHAVELSRLLANTSIPVVSLNTGDTQKLVDKEQFVNPRAELAGEMRRLVNADAISLPLNDSLKRQMTSIRGKPHVSGKIQLESKEDFKARFGRSCDELDVALLSLYDEKPLDAGDFSSIMEMLNS